MQFTFSIWVLTIVVDLFDLDLSDGNIGFRIIIRWK